jgi:hypothetical protein
MPEERLILTLGNHIDLQADEATTLVGGAVRPILVASSKGQPHFHGTGVLFSVAGAHFLATAAHVVHDPTDEVKYVPQKGVAITFGSNSHVELCGRVHRTIPPHGESYVKDLTDAAVIELSEEEAASIDGAQFIDIRNVDVRDQDAPRRGYFLLGYPGAYAKQGSSPHTYKLGYFPFIGFEVPENEYADLGYPRESNLAIRFDRKKSVVSGNVQIAPKPDGTSGGGWWRIDSAFNAVKTESDLKLVAIMSKHYPDDEQALLAVRMSRVVQLLALARPELVRDLPDVSFLPPMSLWQTLPGAFYPVT